MKIFVFGTRGFPNIQGGVEKHCENLYPLLPEDCHLTIFRRKPYIQYSTEKKYNHISFIDFPSSKIRGFETAWHSFLCTLYSMFKRPDIVHIHNIGPAMLAPLLRLRGIKVLVTYHSPNYEHKKWGYFSKLLLKLSERVAFQFSNRIIFVNKFQLEKFKSKVVGKSVYVPNGIDVKQPLLSTNYLEELGVEPKKYILAVGRITPEKGFDYLIKAYKKLPQKDYTLVIAGGVEYEHRYFDTLKKLAENENVIFTGYVGGNNLRELYSHARLFVLSSLNEGFPLVLLEAMNYKLDILVSNIPATHLVELEKDDYYNAQSEKDLSEKLIEKLSQPTTSRKYNLVLFDWAQIAKSTFKVYKQMTNSNHKKRL